jgi:predicted RNA methylase
MRKQSLHFDNLGEVLAASPDSLKRGAQQFETPPEIAAALCSLLPRHRAAIVDLQCGHGNLLRAARNETTEHLLGIDIDPTAACKIPVEQSKIKNLNSKIIHADIGKVFPMLAEVNFKFDLAVLNPPFSLRWAASNFTVIPGIEEAARAANFGSTGNRRGPTIDSTLATYLMALDRMTTTGEAMMICNEATARRLIAPRAEARHIWLWLTLPNFFPGTIQNMEVAVIYFAKDHQGVEPHRLKIPDLSTISSQLSTIIRKRLITGQTIDTNRWLSSGQERRVTVDPFDAVAGEWKRLRDEERGKREWNIELSANGRIHTWLTPFDRIAGRVPMELVEELQKLHNKRPMELVVQRDQREALKRAVEGNVWRVQPEIANSVAAAIQSYNACRAPFIRLNPVQRLGYLDESDTIGCIGNGLIGFSKGKNYPLRSESIENVKIENRKRPESDTKERVEITGLELLFTIRDDHDHWHAFTQHEIEHRSRIEHYHQLAELLENFDIPVVPDVAEARPAIYNEYLNRLDALEAV